MTDGKLTLTERRAKFVYDSVRLAAIASLAPIVPAEWGEREQPFKDQFLEVIERQCSPARSDSPEELYDSLMQSYPDLVPYAESGQLDRDTAAVFIALCDIAVKWIYEGDLQ